MPDPTLQTAKPQSVKVRIAGGGPFSGLAEEAAQTMGSSLYSEPRYGRGFRDYSSLVLGLV